MLALYRHKTNGTFVLLDRKSKTEYTNEKDARQAYAKALRNKNAREKNELLRDLCGTSARVARLDMGL